MKTHISFLYVMRDHDNLTNEPTVCRGGLTFFISLSLLTSIITSVLTSAAPAGKYIRGTLCYCIICLLCLNSQHCVLHHGNGDQKAKVTQRVGRGVARQGRGGGGKNLHMGLFPYTEHAHHLLSSSSSLQG